MKKLLCILSLCLLLVTLLTACGTLGEVVDILQNMTTAPPETSKPTEPPHVCQAGDTLHMDRSNHYYTCQCGEKMNVEKHELVDQVCTICSAKLSAEDIQGLYYLWLLDEQENVVRTQSYSDYGHTLLRTYTFEYRYGEDDKILGRSSYADGVIYSSTNWDEKGNVVVDDKYDREGNLTDAYRYEYHYTSQGDLLSVTTKHNGEVVSKRVMDAQGRVLEDYSYSQLAAVRTEYIYDTNGALSQTLQYTNDTLTCKGIYALQYQRAYLQTEYLYDVQGNYTIKRYDYSGEVISKHTYDANGNPLDLSTRFHPDSCASLLGSWSGEMVISSSMLQADLPDFQLKARLFMELDKKAGMRVIYAIDEDEYRQALLSATTEMLREQFGAGRSQEELDIIFRAEYRKSMQKYVEEKIGAMDLRSVIYQEYKYFYYVSGDTLYSADSCKSLVEGSPYTLKGDTLTFTDPNSSLSLTMTRGGTVPPPPSVNTEVYRQYDPAICEPLFGVWEGTFKKTSLDDPSICVWVTMRLTFLEDGRVLVQEFYDPQEYYAYILARNIYHIYKKYEFDFGYTKEQTDKEFMDRKGVTVAEYAEAQLLPLSQLLPKDHYNSYYLNTHDEWLCIGGTSSSYALTKTTLTFLRYISATENEEFIFTRIG